jgi:hypothetical protein
MHAGATEGGHAWWRPDRLAWWMGGLFALGSVCFAVASFASQWASAPRPGIGVTFFAGSVLFTSAAGLQLWQAVSAPEPRRADRVASLVQFAGTVFFNVSTYEAMQTGFDALESDLRVWAPDVFGSVCFLASSLIAFREVAGPHRRWQPAVLEWRIGALNLLGSVAFGIAAAAALVEPSTSEPVSAAVANAGTTLGALCFLAGALALLPEPARAVSPAGRPRPSP